MIEKFKRLIWLWMQCFRSMRNFRTFIPFILYAMLQGFVLYSLVNFVNAPFSNILIPLIRELFGESALHYPSFFFILSPLYNQINIVLSGFLGIVIIGMATHIFAVNFRANRPTLGQALKETMPKYGVLFIIWILESALSLAMIIGVPQILNELLQPEYRISRLIEMGGLLLGIIIGAIFAYTSALIILDRQKLLRSISQTFMIFKRNAFTTFFLIAVPTFFYFPISYLSRKTDLLISKFSPEIIAGLLGTGIFISLLLSYFQIGSITRFYLLQTEKKKY